VFATAHTKIKGSASEAASDDEGLSSFISEPTAASFQVLRFYNHIQRFQFMFFVPGCWPIQQIDQANARGRQ
jgi:hypothetical protein